MRTIRSSDHGEHVRDVQARLTALGFAVEQVEAGEHRFGPSTESAVRAFQQDRGLLVDGLVGSDTWEELVEAGYALGDRILYLRYPYFRGDDVRALQSRLNVLGFDPGREDGIFGNQTARAVRSFQQNVGLVSDGIVGVTTLQAFQRLRPPPDGLGRAAIREREAMRAEGSLAGRRVAIDAGHGPEDPGAVGPGGSVEAEVTMELAALVAAEVRARGAEPILLRGPGEDPPASQRGARANASRADVLLSLHLNSHPDPGAEGSSAYYFGRLGATSVAGQTLAELVQEEVTRRTGLRDGRAHPKAFALLRETRMPAVHLEPCFLTNPKEEQLLSEERFRRDVVVA
ncbi:MAG: N-acetylmuramoyl-L-alanine amidase, partial [Actinomycetota bacterium]|nr:N-acetylmuramoyl-L-alanine amidase [Actinomycetota bacterium]